MIVSCVARGSLASIPDTLAKKPSSAEERFSLKRRPRLPDPEKSDEIVFDAKK